jgi:histidinol dehydrogenase
MARRLNVSDASFEADFQKLLFAKREEEEDVAAVVRGIIADVRKRGDAALVELTNKFDRAGITQETLKLTANEIDASLAQVSKAQLAAIETAAQRIESYHKRQMPEDARLPTRPARNWAGAGPRSTAWACMCPAAPRLIPLRC